MKIMIPVHLSLYEGDKIYGGRAKSMVQMANWLATHTRHEVHLVSVSGSASAFFVDEKVVFSGLSMPARNKYLRHFLMAMNTVRAVRDCRPDLIVSFYPELLFYIAFSASAKHIPLVFSERAIPRESDWVRRRMRDYVLRRITGVVFQTREVQALYPEAIRKRSVVIPNPVYVKSDDYSLRWDMDCRVVGVGRLEPQKNWPLLIRGFNRISKKHPNLLLEIYGEGYLRDELEMLIASLDAGKRIRLMGAFPDVQERIMGARLFVLPSLYEGMPNALMEAMSMGIPVLSSDCDGGGPRELIRSGENGFLFRNNDEDSLIEMMERSLGMDADALMQMRRAEKKICEDHDADTIFRRWVAFLEAAAGSL